MGWTDKSLFCLPKRQLLWPELSIVAIPFIPGGSSYLILFTQ